MTKRVEHQEGLESMSAHAISPATVDLHADCEFRRHGDHRLHHQRRQRRLRHRPHHRHRHAGCRHRPEQEPRCRRRECAWLKRRANRPAPADARSHAVGGARVAGSRRFARSDRPGDRQQRSAERAASSQGGRAARRDFLHLRVAAQCYRGRGWAMHQERQRHHPPRRQGGIAAQHRPASSAAKLAASREPTARCRTTRRNARPRRRRPSPENGRVHRSGDPARR